MAYCSNCGKPLPESANFCTNCGTQAEPAASENTQRQTVYEGKIHKCPICGEIIDAFIDTCPSCGYVFRGVNAISSAKELALKLEQIDNEKPQPNRRGKITTEMLMRFEREKSEKQAAFIRNFPIPNTKEDLWEFLILSSSNMRAITDDNSIEQKQLSTAWKSKFDQAYNKALIVFSDQIDQDRLLSLYQTAHNENKKDIKMRFLKNWGFILGYLIFFFAIIVFLTISEVTVGGKIKKESERLETIVAEVYECINDKNYTLARFKATTIVFGYSTSFTSDDDDVKEQWDKMRENLLEIIDAAEKGEDYPKNE